MKPLQKIGFLLTAIILIGMFFIAPTQALPLAARNTLGVVLAVIVLLVTEALPLGTVCLLSTSMLVIFGCVGSVSEALSGYTNQVVFFVLASFGISEALTRVPLSRRMLINLMKVFGKSSEMLLFAVMLTVCILSSVISNVAAAAVFLPIILKFMDVYEDEEDRAATKRCYMIGLPIASMIGGMMTPAGSSINMLTIGILEKNYGTTVRFVDWMLFGIPMTVVMLPVAWLICIKVFRPRPISSEKIKEYLNSVELEPKLSGKEIYVLVIILVMLTLWILSSWYPVFNITVVALAGLALFFVPKHEVLTWNQFEKSVNWAGFLLPASMISIGAAITSSGLSVWIADVVFPSTFQAPVMIAVGFVSLLTFILLIPIPVAPALVTMLGVPLINFALNIQISPYLLLITLGLTAANCYLLPLDTVPVMTYTTGAYKMFDMPKATVWIQLVFIVLASLWIPLAGTILGII